MQPWYAQTGDEKISQQRGDPALEAEDLCLLGGDLTVHDPQVGHQPVELGVQHGAQATLRGLQAQKKANKDAIAAQVNVVNGLEEKLGAVQLKIKAIDGQITLGGCVAP